jgi:ACS family D-galactonate transporter-like MFS transporter
MTSKTSKNRFSTLALTFLCQSTQTVSLAGFPLLLPLIRQDLGLTFSQAGGLGSAGLLVYMLMQIPAGYLSDHHSPRNLVAVGALGMMSLSILLAITHEYWQLLVIQFFWGFFSSFIFIPAISVYRGWFSSERRTTATALPSIGMSLGTFAINLLFPVIVNRYDSWRLPFIIIGIVGIIFALGLFLFGRDNLSIRKPAKFRWDIFREIFRYKQVWICYILQFVRFGIVQGISFWLPSLLINGKLFSLQLAGIVIAIQAIILAPGNIFGAYFSDRFKKPTLVIGVSLIMLGITTGLIITLNPVGLIIAVIMLNGLFSQAYFGPLFTLASDKLGPEKVGISNGVGNMFANFGGLTLAYLMGILRDTTHSFNWGFYSICILCAMGLILTYILQKIRHA